MAELQTIRFYLSLTADEIMAYYRGDAESIVATSDDGRRVSFPARVIRPFVSYSGVQGWFLLRYDAEGRFHSIEKIR
ncbi:DUF2835 domain-containing protein [Alkalilimnicola ehrlichii]|nr:DUF2835 domain-containing protein [Alkalilimnicola ehrlichii]